MDEQTGSSSSSSSSSAGSALGVLEHPFLKVPYESLNRSFRNSQKLLEKEMAHVVATYADLQKRADAANPASRLSGSAAVQGIENVVARLHKLKRKVEEVLGKEDQDIQRCKIRLDHLQQQQSAKTIGAPDQQLIWNMTRLDRVIVDHLLREGYVETANKFATDNGILDLVDVDVFLESRSIEEALQRHDCTAALAWCNVNKSRLKKSESDFEFHLRRQEFVELLRSGKRAEAIAHARKHMSPFSDTNMRDIQTAMGCLAFQPSTDCDSYKRLFDSSCWNDLVEEFRHDSFMIHSLTSQSLLSISLQAGLSALKTPMCYQHEDKNPNCPVCSTTINDLARDLPFSHRTQSCIVCRISGEVMNEHNLPMALPNGNVYSFTALQEMARANNGIITDPRTKQTYSVSELRKVFVL
ncbi:macrophage erythroblast attacher protein [Capsaspora owczarzaki ATCC 30864]|uniref:macrophage erythroblast attacher protein n=1 Tax=Capsaspora owczarzaki (strain ATCC 30864) TaxID=595528 RepID=UPI0001FE37C1|nr:macrophage erythroblast attacher protein [Capsaspora owczarzaki ATCC 30864]|eukprot:XP_004346694.1 macrophage erythroblast attacher protein [Capsaspora owczarzaki ATCC 30864]